MGMEDQVNAISWPRNDDLCLGLTPSSMVSGHDDAGVVRSIETIHPETGSVQVRVVAHWSSFVERSDHGLINYTGTKVFVGFSEN
jgi:hypothetical protein